MKKLRLDVESLHVESFATDEGSGSRGTVHGRSAATGITLCLPGCTTSPGDPGESYDDSCGGGESCSCPGPGHCGVKTSNGCEQ